MGRGGEEEEGGVTGREAHIVRCRFIFLKFKFKQICGVGHPPRVPHVSLCF